MIGQQIGSYHVLRKIGAGGMGAVFEAVHQQIGRRAAIKILHGQYAEDPEVATRFLNEARAVNLVQHPGLVSIFEYGQLPDRTAYIIMEYLPAGSLAGRLKATEGGLGPAALRFARQMASALAAAHAQGIIHRDLKPANVMLASDPDTAGGERVKILDFGIAKVAAPAGEAEGPLTRTGAMLGTAAYMSLEQCRNAATADAKSDVYSLGVICYEMLAAAAPSSAKATWTCWSST